jgi:hypothetical protein
MISELIRVLHRPFLTGCSACPMVPWPPGVPGLKVPAQKIIRDNFFFNLRSFDPGPNNENKMLAKSVLMHVAMLKSKFYDIRFIFFAGWK